MGWRKIWLLASQLFFCTKSQNQALNVIPPPPGKKKTHTFRHSLISSGEKVAVVDMTCFVALMLACHPILLFYLDSKWNI